MRQVRRREQGWPCKVALLGRAFQHNGLTLQRLNDVLNASVSVQVADQPLSLQVFQIGHQFFLQAVAVQGCRYSANQNNGRKADCPFRPIAHGDGDPVARLNA